MKHFAATATLAMAILGLSPAGTLAQNNAAKDLTVEQGASPSHHQHHGRYAPHAVQVSLTPIGPSTLAIGEPLRFKMVSLSNGYGHLYVLDASGRTQLWLENVRLRAGRPIIYPRSGNNIVRASPPAGDDTVIFVATRERVDGFAGAGSTTTPLDLQYTQEGFRAALQQKLAAAPRDDWAFAEIKLRVHE